jgi:hypothetical protein
VCAVWTPSPLFLYLHPSHKHPSLTHSSFLSFLTVISLHSNIHTLHISTASLFMVMNCIRSAKISECLGCLSRLVTPCNLWSQLKSVIVSTLIKSTRTKTIHQSREAPNETSDRFGLLCHPITPLPLPLQSTHFSSLLACPGLLLLSLIFLFSALSCPVVLFFPALSCPIVLISFVRLLFQLIKSVIT